VNAATTAPLAEPVTTAPASAPPDLVLTSVPMGRVAWFRDFLAYRPITLKLAKADFQARYKRAAFGMLWAVGIPLIQAALIAIVFSRLISIRGNQGFAAYVLSGIAAWSYFSAALNAGSTAIVDGSSLTDKVWFSRAILPTSPVLSNSPGLFVTVTALLAMNVPLGGHFGWFTFSLIPGIALLLLFVWSLAMVLAALHVYFRDVRFIVQAVLLLWFYVTPLAYPAKALGGLAKYLPYNPMTGILGLFHNAIGVHEPDFTKALIVSVATTVVLLVAAIEVYRRRDRVFVDLL
jgi:lipopolysaccharide transport system permease protein